MIPTDKEPLLKVTKKLSGHTMLIDLAKKHLENAMKDKVKGDMLFEALKASNFAYQIAKDDTILFRQYTDNEYFYNNVLLPSINVINEKKEKEILEKKQYEEALERHNQRMKKKAKEKKIAEDIKKKKLATLSEFIDQELVKELRDRGYVVTANKSI